MCGIICAFNAKGEATSKWVREQLQNQLSRGKEGFGVINFDPTTEIEIERSCEITGILVPMMMNESNGVFLHHRMPTSSDNRIGQTHPIKCTDESFKYDWYVMHNGVIQNDDEVREEHMEMGFRYGTDHESYSTYARKNMTKFNDSECVAWEVAIIGEASDKLKKKGELVLRTEGNNAFMALKVDKKTQKAVGLLWGRNDGNPLNFHKGGNDEFYWSSTGIGQEVEANKMFEMDLKTRKISSFDLEIPEWVRPTYSYNATTKVCKKDKCFNTTYLMGGVCTPCLDKEREEEEKTKKKGKPATKEAQVVSAAAAEEKENIGFEMRTDEFESADPFDTVQDHIEAELLLLLDSMRDSADGTYQMDYETEKQILMEHMERKLDDLHAEYVEKEEFIRSCAVGTA